jgi:hypothetical protein
MEFGKGGVFVGYFNEEKSTRLTAHSPFGLTFWRPNYFFLNFSTPVYKM